MICVLCTYMYDIHLHAGVTMVLSNRIIILMESYTIKLHCADITYLYIRM